MFCIFIFGVTSFILILILEQITPFKKEWNTFGKEEAKDIFHSFFGTNLGALIGNFINLSLIEFTYKIFNLSPKMGLNIWPSEFPLVVQVLLVMIIADFGRYWQHRLHHMNKKMWYFHELHHDENVLNSFKTSRSHLIERLSQQTAMFFPLFLIGVNREALYIYMLVNSMLGLFAHSNLDIRCGLLESVFMCPRNHKLHHSLNMKHGNTNFGSTTVIWDRIFKTYTHPSELKSFSEIKVGVIENNIHKPIKDQVLDPFKKLFS